MVRQKQGKSWEVLSTYSRAVYRKKSVPSNVIVIVIIIILLLFSRPHFFHYSRSLFFFLNLGNTKRGNSRFMLERPKWLPEPGPRQVSFQKDT